MSKEYCQKCEQQTENFIFKREENVSTQEREIQETKSKLKECLSSEKMFKQTLEKDPENKYALVMIQAVKSQIQQISEKLLSLLPSANECNEIIVSLQAQVKNEVS